MKVNYLVTTNADAVAAVQPAMIAMVDGTVPGIDLEHLALHFDHHRPGGPDIQSDDIQDSSFWSRDRSVLDQYINDRFSDRSAARGRGWLIVTTQVDADACVAAAMLQLVPDKCTKDALMRLRAIAYDCDHLCLPAGHFPDSMASFAAQAVAALKAFGFGLACKMGLPKDRREWSEAQRTDYASACFKQGTEWLLDAAYGTCPWPGEGGEAADYWDQVESDAESATVAWHQGIPIFSTVGVGRYVDPRAHLHALAATGIQPAFPITLTIRDHKSGGLSYTLGSIPFAEDKLDFSTLGVWDALTRAEQAQWERVFNELSGETLPTPDGWGGRATVGGSGWNTASLLNPAEVVEVVLHTINVA